MADLPTWTFRPDWASDVVERIEWRTALLGSLTGPTQAIATRVEPRRSVEARFMLTDAERSFLGLTLQRMGSATFLVPLWFHRAALTAAVAAGGTSLPCDTVNREFRAGDFALLVGDDAFGGETVEISSVASGALTLVGPLVGDWPLGTVVHPLREGVIDPGTRTLTTSIVGEGSIRFDFDAGNDLAGGAETFTLYNGYPVVTQRPNWADALTQDYAWLQDTFDSAVGLREIVDTAGRAFTTLRYGLMLQGRAEQMAFRQLLYRLRGRQGAVWMPSHAFDATVALGAASGASALEIERIGLAEVGGVADDIAHLLIGDDLAVQWSALATPSSTANEKLTLSAGLSRDVVAGERASLLSLARLDQDVVTLNHKTDSDGVATVNLAWTAFDGSRDGSAAGDYPIAAAAMAAGACGITGTCALHFQISATNWPLYGDAATSALYMQFFATLNNGALNVDSWMDPAALWDAFGDGSIYGTFDEATGTFDVWQTIAPLDPASDGMHVSWSWDSSYPYPTYPTALPAIIGRWRKERVEDFSVQGVATATETGAWNDIPATKLDGVSAYTLGDGAAWCQFASNEFAEPVANGLCP